MKKSTSYAIPCPTCGAGKWEACTTLETSRFKEYRGRPRKRAHPERIIDAQEAAVKLRPKDCPCPSCGAQPGEKCRKYTRPAKPDEIPDGFGDRGARESPWMWAGPNKVKTNYCSSRYDVARGYGMLDAEESATESGLWVPPEWHETATAEKGDYKYCVFGSGLLSTLPDEAPIEEEEIETAPMKPRPVGQRGILKSSAEIRAEIAARKAARHA